MSCGGGLRTIFPVAITGRLLTLVGRSGAKGWLHRVSTRFSVNFPLTALLAAALSPFVRRVAVGCRVAAVCAGLASAMAFGSAPTFVGGPDNVSVPVDISDQFSVIVSGSYPITQRWQKLDPGASTWGDIAATDATFLGVGAVLGVRFPTLAMNGTKVRCIASNPEGSAISPAATLTVYIPRVVTHVFVSGPVRAVPFFQELRLYADYTPDGNAGRLSFQWYRDGVALPGATGPTYFVPNATPANSGSYAVTVTNLGGSVSGAPLEVVVEAAMAPHITTQPVSLVAEQGLGFTLAAAATGSQPLTYQWWRNGVAISDATLPTYTVTVAQPADGGSYTFSATNTEGTVVSAAAVVDVVSPALPRLSTSSTQSGTVVVDPSRSALELTVSVEAGAPPFSYQWFKDGVALPGATGATLWIRDVSGAAAGVYVAEVSNAAGVVVSGPRRVVPNPPPAIPWIDAQRLGDVMYFLFANPGRILRYDLAGEAWLPAIALDASRRPTGFLPTPEGIFVAYGGAVVRRAWDSAIETPVSSDTGSIGHFFARGNLIYYLGGRGYVSYDRLTLSAGPSGYLPNGLAWGGLDRMQAVMGPVSGRGYTAEPNLSGSSLVRFEFDGGGAITTGLETKSDAFSPGIVVAVAPDESLVYSSGGAVYTASTFDYVAGLGAPFSDIVFLPDGSPVVLRARELTWYQGSIPVEQGRRQLSAPADRLATKGGAVFVFSAPPTAATNPGVVKVTTSEFSSTSLPPRDVSTTRLSVDEAFIDDDGTVYAASRVLRGIARWNTRTHAWLPTLAFRGYPLAFGISPSAKRLVTGDGEGTLREFNFGSDSHERVIGNVPLTLTKLTLTLADDLTIANAGVSGSFYPSQFVIRSDGTTSFHSGQGARHPYDYGQTWDAGTRRLYASSVDESSWDVRTLNYAVVPTSGELPGAFAVSTPGPPEAFPLRASVTSSELLARTGKILSKDLAPLGDLGTPVTDGVWMPDALYTIRPDAIGITVERWSRSGYGRLGSIQVAGKPVRILRESDSRVVIVAVIEGYLAFHSISTTLGAAETYLSNPATGGLPILTRHPLEATTASGENATFAVTVAPGSHPSAYRWEMSADGASGWSEVGLQAGASGASTSTLTIVANEARNGSYYRCAVSNGAGTVWSLGARLSVAAAPVGIVASPVSVTAPAGAAVSFAVQAGGSSPLSYQWQGATSDSGPWADLGAGYTGAQSAMLALIARTEFSGMRYRCAVSNAANTAWSAAATLTVGALGPPSIAASPVSVTTAPGSSAVFTVAAAGAGPFAYRWQFAPPGDGGWQDVTGGGADTATLTIPGDVGLNGYRVRCVVGNAGGTATSAPATLTVAAAPGVALLSPRRTVVVPGRPVQLAVAASGAGPFAYQWYRNGRPLSGATAATWSSAAADYNAAGYYYVDVTGLFGTRRSAAMFVLVAPASTRVQGWSSRYSPPDLSNLENVVAIAADSYAVFGITRTGRVVTRAFNTADPLVAPAGLDEVVDVSSLNGCAIALRSDGTVVTWGNDTFGRKNVPAGLTDVVAVSMGWYHVLALKSDGRIVTWSSEPRWRAVPADLPPAIEVSAHISSVALLADGSTRDLLGGSSPGPGLRNLETMRGSDGSFGIDAGGALVLANPQFDSPLGVTGVRSVVGEASNGLAVKRDGTVVAWGSSSFYDGLIVPPGLRGVVQAARPSWGSVALVAVPVTDLEFISTRLPPRLAPGAQGSLALEVRNVGTTNWGAADALVLWDSAGAPVASAGLTALPPDSQAVRLAFTAPRVPGRYRYTLQAWESGTGLFGAARTYEFEVRAGGMDFNADGNSDLVWSRAATGEVALWEMSGANLAGSAVYGPGANWVLVATKDFDGDGRADLLWRNASDGSVVLWRMNGTSVVASDWLYSGGTAWVPERCGDFNGDGKADLLWHNASEGLYAIWLMDGAALAGSAAFGLGGEWSVSAVADFGGDGKSDLLWRESGNGSLVLWEMNGTAVANSAWIYTGGPAWQPEHSGDFNADGKADLLWRNSATGQYAMWLMNGANVIGSTTYDLASAWRVTAVPDLNGDGCADLLWRNRDDGSVVLWQMQGAAVTNSGWLYTGGPWEPVHSDDFNGDGKADLLWFSASDGLYAIWLMDGLNTVGSSAFGVPAGWATQP